MSSVPHIHDTTIPRGAFWFAGAVIATTVLAGVAVRTGLVPVAASPALERAAGKLKPVEARRFTFTDRTDGGLAITDLATGSPRHSLAPGGESGFIRGVIRGMSFERRKHGVGPGAPYVLELWPNGQLSLTDPSTGRSVELSAFGGTNRAAFAALLK